MTNIINFTAIFTIFYLASINCSHSFTASEKKAVIAVKLSRIDGSNEIPIRQGSGILLNKDGYFLTANHVIKEWIEAPDRYIVRIAFADARQNGFKIERSIGCAEDADICVAKIFPNIVESYNVTNFFGISCSSLSAKDQISVAGFPGTGEFSVDQKNGRVTGGLVDSGYSVDATALPGMSGGPTIEIESNQLIGIVTVGLDQAQRARISPVFQVRNLLANTTATCGKKEERDSFTDLTGQSFDYSTGSVEYSISNIRLLETTLNSKDLSDIFDPENNTNLNTRLNKLNAHKITIPQLKISMTDSDFNSEILLTGIEMTTVNSGRIQDLTIKSAEIDFLKSTGLNQGKAIISNISSESMDLYNLLSLVDGNYSLNSQPELASKIGADKITLTLENGDTFNSGKLLLNNIKGSQRGVEQFKQADLINFLTKIAGSAVIQSGELQDINIVDNSVEGNSEISISRLLLSNMSNAKLGSLNFLDTEVRQKAGYLQAEVFKIFGFDFTSTLDWISGEQSDRAKSRLFSGLFEAIPIARQIQLSNLLLSSPVSSNAAAVQTNSSRQVQLGNLNFTLGSFSDEIPQVISLALNDLSTAFSNSNEDNALGRSLSFLQELGYERANVSANTDLKWVPDSGDLYLDINSIQASDVGLFSTSLHLFGVDKEKFTGNVLEIFSKILLSWDDDLKLYKFKSRFENHGIVQKIISSQAIENEVSEVEYTNQIIGIIPAFLARLEPAENLLQVVQKESRSFLENPKNFNVEVISTTPFSLQNFLKKENAEKIDIGIYANSEYNRTKLNDSDKNPLTIAFADVLNKVFGRDEVTEKVDSSTANPPKKEEIEIVDTAERGNRECSIVSFNPHTIIDSECEINFRGKKSTGKGDFCKLDVERDKLLFRTENGRILIDSIEPDGEDGKSGSACVQVGMDSSASFIFLDRVSGSGRCWRDDNSFVLCADRKN